MNAERREALRTLRQALATLAVILVVAMLSSTLAGHTRLAPLFAFLLGGVTVLLIAAFRYPERPAERSGDASGGSGRGSDV